MQTRIIGRLDTSDANIVFAIKQFKIFVDYKKDKSAVSFRRVINIFLGLFKGK